MISSEGSEEESFPCLPPSFWWFADHLSPFVAYGSISPGFALRSLCVFVSMSKFPFLIKTLITLDWGPTLIQYDLILA